MHSKRIVGGRVPVHGDAVVTLVAGFSERFFQAGCV